MNARHKLWAGKHEAGFIFRLCEIEQSEFYTWTDLLIMIAREPLAGISAFLSDDRTPAFSLQPVAVVRKAIDSMPTRNVFCLSLLKVGRRRHATGRACWFGWARTAPGLPGMWHEACKEVGNHPGCWQQGAHRDLFCSLETPLQPRVLNSSFRPVWVRVIALSMLSPAWLTRFTGFTFHQRALQGEEQHSGPCLGSGHLFSPRQES